MAGSPHSWADASVAWHRRVADTPSAVVSAAALQPGARVRCFYLKGGRKSVCTDVGVITATSLSLIAATPSGPHGGAQNRRPDSPATASLSCLTTPSVSRPAESARSHARSRRRSAKIVGRQRVDLVEVLFDDGALQDVPKSWISSLLPERRTPGDEVLREIKDGVCRVTRVYAAQRAGELSVAEGERVMVSESHALSHKHQGWVYASRIVPHELSLSPQRAERRGETRPGAGRAGAKAGEQGEQGKAHVVRTHRMPREEAGEGEADGQVPEEQGEKLKRVGGLVPRHCIELSWGGMHSFSYTDTHTHKHTHTHTTYS